ncbi:MAG: hypothetical protein M5U31_01040 [Acidimicrobiia bacterium]|nr:hypothetical protein [Acidimicrobiia bacterium]
MILRTRHRQWACLVSVLALTLTACGNDASKSPTVAEGSPMNADEYAAEVTRICNEAVKGADDAIDSADEVYDIDAASEALMKGADDLAAVTPPEDRADMGQALVDSLTEYSDLVKSADNDPEEFSQNQNALELTISVRVAGLDAECEEVPYVLEPPVAPEEGLDDYFEAEFGDDPEADALAQRCFEGELAACDDVRHVDAYRAYGVDCGGRVYIEEANAWPDCVDLFVGQAPVRGQILSEPRETEWCTGNLEDCD